MHLVRGREFFRLWIWRGSGRLAGDNGYSSTKDVDRRGELRGGCVLSLCYLDTTNGRKCGLRGRASDSPTPQLCFVSARGCGFATEPNRYCRSHSHVQFAALVILPME